MSDAPADFTSRLARVFDETRKHPTFAGEARISFVPAGRLVIAQGPLAVADPQFLADAKPLDELNLPPDAYDVRLSIATYADGDQRIAAAWFNLSDRDPATFRRVRGGEIGIDSGVACFADANAVRALSPRKPSPRLASVLRELDRRMSGNYADTRGYGDMSLDSRTGASMVAFSSGFGDGGYATYLALDRFKKPARVLMDFGLLLTEDEIEEMDPI